MAIVISSRVGGESVQQMDGRMRPGSAQVVQRELLRLADAVIVIFATSFPPTSNGRRGTSGRYGFHSGLLLWGFLILTTQ